MTRERPRPVAGCHFAIATLQVMPWKNGGGSTREIASWPPGAGLAAFEWRVSIASIAASGPFSVFPGIDRAIMLLEGDGVQLRAPDGHLQHRLDQPLHPFAFSGDEAVECTVLGGESSDFNAMARRRRWHVDVQVLRGDASIAPAPHGVLLAFHGDWRLSSSKATGGVEAATNPARRDDASEAIACSEGSGVWWADLAQGWHAETGASDACLVVARFTAPHAVARPS